MSEPRKDFYDPQLPFLAELEQQVRRHAERAAARMPETQPRHGQRHAKAVRALTPPSGRADPAPADPQAERDLRPGRQQAGASRLRGGLPHGRVARRALALVGLLCLIGASAYAAGLALSGASKQSPISPAAGPFVTVAHGSAGSERFALRLYARGGELCRVLLAGETLSSRCQAAPAATGVQATSAQSPLHRYVYGVTGAQVARVRVRVGKQHQSAVTHTLAARRALAAGLPAGVRYYLLVLGRPAGTAAPAAIVQGLSASGRASGSALQDCPETTQDTGCAR